MSVDYTQWERNRQKQQMDRKLSAPRAGDAESFAWGNFSVSNNPSRLGSACSLSKCNHPWNNFRAREAARLAEEQKKARMKEIKIKIRLHQKTLHEIKARQADLIRSNLDMFHLIENDEHLSLKSADDCLKRYQKSRDGIHVMRERFERQKLELKQELAELKQRLDSSTAKLKADLQTVADEAKEIYDELALLNNYKDKVYPERLILIHQLKQQLVSSQLDNEEEESELLEVIQAEHMKLLGGDQKSVEQMKAAVAQKALSELHPTIVAMAEENKQLTLDADFHRRLNQQLQRDIKALELTIEELSQHPDSSLPRSMFPQIFRKQQRCTPDMDVFLDIPTRKLPII